MIAEASVPTADDIVRWLLPTVEPGAVVELRALNCVDNPKYGAFTISGFFDADHLAELAQAALQVTAQAEGVYVTMNPVNRALLARASNRVHKIKKDLATKDQDIVRRTQLVFDADPTRPAGISATDAEKALALEKANLLIWDLTGRGWPEPTLADSGNGYHVKYRIDLPNDDGSLELVKTVLATANQLFGDGHVKIDGSLSNASRIIKLPGTLARKGDNIPDRPHRRSRLLSAPSKLLVVPTERLEALAALFVPKIAAINGQHPNGHGGHDPFVVTVPPSGGASAEVRAKSYVFANGFPDSIAGQNGHDRLFHVACVLVDGFGLPEFQARKLLGEWNQQKAVPPEDDKQVNHKIDSAIKKHPTPSLKLLNADRPATSGASARPSAKPAATVVEDEAEIIDRWPKIRPEAFHGLAGDIVRLCDPETEADPVAVLLQVLAGFGNMVGRRPYFVVNATRHYLNLFVALVGLTATGRKGTSWDVARHPLAGADRDWAENRVLGGLVSGEGLIFHVRDPIIQLKSAKDPETKKITIVPVEVDAGVPDKRLQVIETEMGRVLKAMSRDSSTLSEVLRQCWDSGNLRTLNRKDPLKATGAHISVVAHITPADVRRHLDETDSANGFANRFLWVCARRSKLLPEGGDVFAINWGPIQERLADAVEFARDTTGVDWTLSDGGSGRRMNRDPGARKAWNAIYEELSAGKPGLLGKVLSRAEAQVMRVACLYALLDCSAEVRPEHLVAALAVWDYCTDSARLVFGEGMGDPDAEKLLAALKDADGGLTRTQITVDVFAKHKKAAEIATLLSDLLTQGLIHRVTRSEGKGRPTERWFHGKEEDAN